MRWGPGISSPLNTFGRMRDTELFQMALALVPPWKVKASTFDPTQRRLEILIDFPEGERLPCPICGAACRVHDTESKTWPSQNPSITTIIDVPEGSPACRPRGLAARMRYLTMKSPVKMMTGQASPMVAIAAFFAGGYEALRRVRAGSEAGSSCAQRSRP
jgi:hypothetical protein